MICPMISTFVSMRMMTGSSGPPDIAHAECVGSKCMLWVSKGEELCEGAEFRSVGICGLVHPNHRDVVRYSKLDPAKPSQP